MEWRNIYRGMITGATDVVPGISGGTILVMLGIYDQVVAAINGLFSKEWKKQLGFLIPLGIGVLLAIFTLSRVLEWLLHHHAGPTYFFFLGLILGILPFLFRKAEARRTFRMRHYLLLAIGAVLIGSLIFVGEREVAVIEQFTFGTYLLLFFSGFIGSSAMILPGVSGSFMLLVLGVYPTVISAISNLQLDIIAVTGAGIAIGLIAMSKLINYCLTRFGTGTFAVIIGSVFGSVFVIFPGWPASGALLVVSMLTFATGLLTAYLLGKVEY
ncbi:DUF368 domain-containing protein [Xylanibacillus composti]|uniref:DUF368 domain-containing protein n=1 Tax=Xylanibacillus composti TaxID=1572762 RepID=A0A8J4M244_9BACL|nr:DUF368 domain-containing protein [Xylanibacillus composti]MDT9724087.1 DUF368 domain-containing protein [Xylanibacillus composti]GIQ69480.1 DUF368 domain-containing protein [Xylanibacillus composti]